jgi:hypothetical protein
MRPRSWALQPSRIGIHERSVPAPTLHGFFVPQAVGSDRVGEHTRLNFEVPGLQRSEIIAAVVIRFSFGAGLFISMPLALKGRLVII